MIARVPDFTRDDLVLLYSAVICYQEQLLSESASVQRSIELAELEEQQDHALDVLRMIEVAIDEPPFNWAA